MSEIQLQVGRAYRTKYGYKAIPISIESWDPEVRYPFEVEIHTNCGKNKRKYSHDGVCFLGMLDLDDIVEVWVDRIPVRPEDICPGSLIRCVTGQKYAWKMITSVQVDSVRCDSGAITFQELADHYEIMLPGKHWEPCYRKST